MDFPRSSGVLLHPTSLPGRFGVGDLGEYAYRFVDFLQASEQSLWQVLPLGPTSFGDSPYQSPSTFAGNPNLISMDVLVGDGYLTNDDFDDLPDFPAYRVDYGPVIEYHNKKLKLAFSRFDDVASDEDKKAFADYCEANKLWLDDYALFMAVKDAHQGRPWTMWDDDDLIRYQPAALEKTRTTHADAIKYYQFTQWVFKKQWTALKEYAAERKIRIMGDIPIFVAHDSSDVWGNQHLYFLNEDGTPKVIAGVPPDYFSETGQRWGNPLYRWDVMKENDYAWWKRRFKTVFELVDLVRVDHFRGFEAYWEIPAEEETAINGTWVKGPGMDFIKSMKEALGELPIVAEDLGVITPEVEALRDEFDLPGMQVLQFAFDGACGSNTFLPHHYPVNTIVYTGTHDNNTTFGWWHSDEAHDGIQDCVATYTGILRERLDTNIHREMMRLASSSVAHTCVFPMQDVLGFGADTRMNTPGKSENNWAWRFGEEELQNAAKEDMAALTRLYTRNPGSGKARVNY
ncbi:MAG: 4-alpha-glucanotransferase [Chloroflexota bacterium]